jgi:hypothetical protein
MSSPSPHKPIGAAFLVWTLEPSRADVAVETFACPPYDDFVSVFYDSLAVVSSLDMCTASILDTFHNIK